MGFASTAAPHAGRIVAHPEHDAMLRLLAIAGGTLRASTLFARVESEVDDLRLSDFGALASEARKLSALGLVSHGRDASGCITLSLTHRGRRLCATRRHARLSGISAGAAAVPLLAACMSLPWSKPTPSAEPRPVMVEPTRRLSQVVYDGAPTWTWCSPDQCPTPTPKTVTYGAPPRAAGPPAVAAPMVQEPRGTTPPLPAPSPAAPATAPPLREPERVSSAQDVVNAISRGVQASFRAGSPAPVSSTKGGALTFQAYTVFYRYGSSELAPAERDVVQRAAAAARSAHRVFVVGMTDASGDARLNLRLAERRASGVKSLLEASGVSARIARQSDTSASRPVPAGAIALQTPPGDARFRRVDIVVATPPPTDVITADRAGPEASIARLGISPGSSDGSATR